MSHIPCYIICDANYVLFYIRTSPSPPNAPVCSPTNTELAPNGPNPDLNSGNGESTDESSSDLGSTSDEDTGPVPAKRKLPVPHPQVGKRRKGMLQHVQELAAADRDTRLKMVEVRAREKTRRRIEREKLRCEAERVRLDFEARERERQRAHELQMLTMQLEIERIRAGQVTSHALAPPPSDCVIDPLLRNTRTQV